MPDGKKTVSAKADKNLRDRIENYQKENNHENKTDAVRALWREGLEADQIRQENAELREELEERRTRDENSVRITKGEIAAVTSTLGLALLVIGSGLIEVELQVGTTELGISVIFAAVLYAVYHRYKASTAESDE